MRKYLYLILLLSVICNGCNRQSESIDYFKDIKTITEYDKIYSDKDDETVGIMGIYKYKNTLISYNRASDCCFSFYDIEKGVNLGSWGYRGRGPNEFFSPGGVAIIDSLLVFSEDTKKEIYYVPIKDILNNEKNINIRSESYPRTADFKPLLVEVINDKKIALGGFKDSRFGVLDEKNNIIDCPSDYPFNYEEIPGVYRGFAFQSLIKSNREQSKFVISTFYSDIFEIYQITDVGIDRVYVNPFNHIPEIRETPGRNSGYDIDHRNSVGGLKNIAATDDFIYFVYNPKKAAESFRSSNLSNEILCFNWEGEKVRKYILPFPINPISLCVDDEYIYGVRDLEDETVIYRFKM